MVVIVVVVVVVVVVMVVEVVVIIRDRAYGTKSVSALTRSYPNILSSFMGAQPPCHTELETITRSSSPKSFEANFSLTTRTICPRLAQ